MTKTILSRREKERLRHKKEIMATAMRLFSEKGFYNVSMQEIAEKSEFGVGTLYNFFESKDALFEELLKDAALRIEDDFTEILDRSGCVRKRLSQFIKNQPFLLKQYGDVLRLLVSEFGIRGSKLRRITDKNDVYDAMRRKLSALIAEGIERGVFRDVDVDIATRSLLATIETFIFDILEDSDNQTTIPVFDKIEHFFIEGLLI